MASQKRAARSAIEKAINDGWTPDAPLAWEGVKFDPPSGPWLRISIRWGDGFERTIGPAGEASTTTVGLVIAQVFGRPGKGKKEIEDLADMFSGLVTRKVIGPARFGAPSGPVDAGTDERGWMQVNVTAPFEIEEAA